MSAIDLGGGRAVILGQQGPPGAIAADFIVSAPGPQPVGETWPYKVGHGVTIARSGGDALVASTGTVAIKCYKSGALFSTVTYSAGNPIPTMTGIGAAILDSDRVDIVWPNTQDATLSGITFYFATA